ncbi:hypothetical protein [Dongia sp.]|uniref:hypothetical protein n=1 Tax=Dongia sp. TaxID=1977262 RepID=UPI0035B2852B
MRYLIFAVLLVVSACASTSAPKSTSQSTASATKFDVGQFADIKDVPSFWKWAYKYAHDRKLRGHFIYTSGFRDCASVTATKLSSPRLVSAVNTFVADRTKANADALVLSIKNGEVAYVTEQAAYKEAIEKCYLEDVADDFVQYADVTTPYEFFVRSMKRIQGRPVNWAEPEDLMKCLYGKLEATLSPEFKSARDVFIAEKTEENWRKLISAESSLGSEAEENAEEWVKQCFKDRG